MTLRLTQGNARKLVEAALKTLQDLLYLHGEYLRAIEEHDPSDLEWVHPNHRCEICEITVPQVEAVLTEILGHSPYLEGNTSSPALSSVTDIEASIANTEEAPDSASENLALVNA